MKRTRVPDKYKRDFVQRVTTARRATGQNQEQFARSMGLKDRDAWAKYESRSLLPHDLIGQFCELTGFSIDWLLTGRQKAQ